jgi:hypothetical protein
MENKRSKGRPRLIDNEDSRRVTLTFPQSLVEKLSSEAKSRDISFAALIREKVSS